MRGTAQDIRALDYTEIKKQLADLGLSKNIDSLWRRYLKSTDVEKKPIKTISLLTPIQKIVGVFLGIARPGSILPDRRYGAGRILSWSSPVL